MNQISEELSALDSSLTHASSTPFAVPEGYFDSLPAQMLARVKENLSVKEELQLLSHLLAEAENKNPYSVPGGYFSNNLENLSFVYQEENSPVLELIGKKMPYEVPTGYFAAVEDGVKQKMEKPVGKLVSFNTRWMRMAAAAILTGVIALAGYNYFQEDQGDYTASRQDTMQQQTAALGKDQAIESQLKTISVKELDAFINNVEAAATATASKKTSTAADLKELLKDIPDKDLEMFLDQVPTGKDELSLID